MATKKFYIKERHNPQLGVYYEACGQLTKTDAKRYERPLYGSNVMHGFDTEEAYMDRLCELREAGKKVHTQQSKRTTLDGGIVERHRKPNRGEARS